MGTPLVVPTMQEMLAQGKHQKFYFGQAVQVVLMIEQKKLQRHL